MSMICIYHANCNDGMGAALAVYHRYGDESVTFIPMHYGDFPTLDEVSGKDVFIVDFSFKRPEMLKIASVASTVTVIDHHKTAEAELSGIEKEASNLVCVFDMDRSGAALAWEFFHGEVPELIRHIEDRDLWNFELTGTREIHSALGIHLDWKEWLHFSVDSLMREGSAIREYLDLRADEVSNHPPVAWDITGDQVPVYNIQGFMISDTLHMAMKKHNSPYAVAYFEIPGKRIYSLRSMDGSDVDVSEIAKAHGGGGHKHAAGFSVNLEHKTPLSDMAKQLSTFYQVDNYDALVEAQSQHVERLQKKLEKYERPVDFSPQKVRG